MIDKTDMFLYGGVVVAGVLVIFLGYRFFRRSSEKKPKSQVMNKINDFYKTQDSSNIKY